MKKEDFKRELINALLQKPLATRKVWNGGHLMEWWQEIKRTNSYMRPDGVRGDEWQLVHSYCQDLIGEKAIR